MHKRWPRQPVQCTSVHVAALPSIPDFPCLVFVSFLAGGWPTPFNIPFLPGSRNFPHPVHSFQQYYYYLFSHYLVPTTISSPDQFRLFLMLCLCRCFRSTPSHFLLFLFLTLLHAQFQYNLILPAVSVTFDITCSASLLFSSS